MVIYRRRKNSYWLYFPVLPDCCYIYNSMFVYNISREGNNVDIKTWTTWKALIYGASAGIMLYIFLWLCELGHAWIWGY